MIIEPRVVISSIGPLVRVSAGGASPVQVRLQVVHPRIAVSPVGARGASGEGTTVEHIQSSPEVQWVFNHNLGAKPSAVQVLDAGGNVLFADVMHVSDNQLRVNFVTPKSGSVRASL